MKHIFWFQHKYESISSIHGKGDAISSLSKKIEKNVDLTLILKQCACGVKKTELIRGHWIDSVLRIKKG